MTGRPVIADRRGLPGRSDGRARAARILAAIAMALGTAWLLPAAGSSPVGAAGPSLSFVTAARYAVLPDEGRVAVTVQITATNHLRDTVTRRFYFTEGYLSVMSGATNFAIRGATGSPTVAVSSRTASGAVLRIRFGSRLEAGESRNLALTFDLVDPGGAPERPLRISPSLVSFEAWAFGSGASAGSSVEVVVPEGYEVALARGPLTGPTVDDAGRQVFASGPLSAPLGFAVDVTADRPGGFVEGSRSATVGGTTVILRIRAWPDDPAWRARVADLMLASLPVLAEAIGSPWPLDGPLTVQESFTREADGAAGAFNPEPPLVEVSYLASPDVVLHAAAHGWFNGRLVTDRWIAEGFARYYATTAAEALEIALDVPDSAAVSPHAALPLNAWGGAGTTEDQDAYGYGASLALAREIAATVGDEALQAVWRAAAAGSPAYALGGGIRDADGGTPPPDWRALLDLLEEGATGEQAATLEGLWRGRVARAADTALLDRRIAARSAYRALVAEAAPWALPST
ncbi:MAG: hypothetical protein HW391_1249, partial [Chloroflexi bacterium]|nr:hypothetical protein [Chloroflexota bacterium]